MYARLCTQICDHGLRKKQRRRFSNSPWQLPIKLYRLFLPSIFLFRCLLLRNRKRFNVLSIFFSNKVYSFKTYLYRFSGFPCENSEERVQGLKTAKEVAERWKM